MLSSTLKRIKVYVKEGIHGLTLRLFYGTIIDDHFDLALWREFLVAPRKIVAF
jgi:hypothetical protein